MNPLPLGAWVAIVLSAAGGVLGGLIGTCVSIRNTRGPRERAFVVKVAVACWGLIAAALAGLFVVPRPFWLLLFLPCTGLLPLIPTLNRVQSRIRREESGEED